MTAASIHLSVSRILAAAIGCAAALSLCAAASADIFVLRDGGQIEGDEISRDDALIQIRTASAQVSVPIDQVLRVDKPNPALAAYRKLAGEYPPTAAGHYKLALWCREQNLPDQARQEFKAALAADPNFVDAHKALGHVQIGDVWLEPGAKPAPPLPDTANTVRSPTTRPADPAQAMQNARLAVRDSDRDLVTLLRAEWYKRIRSIRVNYLTGSSRDQFSQGAEMLLAIRDPLAVEPMIQLLANGSAEQRKLLIAAIADFRTSSATMALLEASVLDNDAEVRRLATAALATRSDPRIATTLLRWLASDDEDVVRNAAGAIGRMKIVDAVPALARELTGKDSRRVPVATMVPTVRGYFIDATGQWQPITWGRRATDPFGPAYKTVAVTVYRTAVQEALIAITGENHGFDSDAWLDWYRNYQSRNGSK